MDRFDQISRKVADPRPLRLAGPSPRHAGWQRIVEGEGDSQRDVGLMLEDQGRWFWSALFPGFEAAESLDAALDQVSRVIENYRLGLLLRRGSGPSDMELMLWALSHGWEVEMYEGSAAVAALWTSPGGHVERVDDLPKPSDMPSISEDLRKAIRKEMEDHRETRRIEGRV